MQLQNLPTLPETPSFDAPVEQQNAFHEAVALLTKIKQHFAIASIPDEELKANGRTRGERKAALQWLVERGYVEGKARATRAPKAADSASVVKKDPSALPKQPEPVRGAVGELPEYILLTHFVDMGMCAVEVLAFCLERSGKVGRPSRAGQVRSKHAIPLGCLDYEAYAIEAHLKECWPGSLGRSAWEPNGAGPNENQVWFRLLSKAHVRTIEVNTTPE